MAAEFPGEYTDEFLSDAEAEHLAGRCDASCEWCEAAPATAHTEEK
jgi:hypothetical protein